MYSGRSRRKLRPPTVRERQPDGSFKEVTVVYDDSSSSSSDIPRRKSRPSTVMELQSDGSFKRVAVVYDSSSSDEGSRFSAARKPPPVARGLRMRGTFYAKSHHTVVPPPPPPHAPRRRPIRQRLNCPRFRFVRTRERKPLRCERPAEDTSDSDWDSSSP